MTTELPPQPPPHPSSSPPEGEPARPDERVSTLIGDRLCIKCGYNLTGQSVVRESHYQMLIVRCPECATVASLQEYPILGVWAQRWGALLAAAWLVSLLASFLIVSLMLSTAIDSIAYSAAWPLGFELEQRQTAWQADLPPTQSPSPSYDGELNITWWRAQNRPELLAEMGGWTEIADWSALFGLGWVLAIAIPAGILWSAAMLHLRRNWVLLVTAVATGALTILFVVREYSYYSYWGVMGKAVEMIGPYFSAMALLFAIVPLAIGVYFGRPILRVMLRAMLPPRLRGPFAVLWTAEGLNPPVPGGGAIRTAR